MGEIEERRANNRSGRILFSFFSIFTVIRGTSSSFTLSLTVSLYIFIFNDKMERGKSLLNPPFHPDRGN